MRGVGGFLHKEDGGKYVKFRVKDDVSILAQNGVVLGKNFSQIWVEIKKIITIGGNRPRHSHAPFIPLHADIKNYPCKPLNFSKSRVQC